MYDKEMFNSFYMQYIFVHVLWVPVTMAWHVLGLQMEETASRYIYKQWITSCRQLKRGDLPAWGLSKCIHLLTMKNQLVTKCYSGS